MEKFKFGQFDNSADATVFTTANGYGETDGEETTRRQFSYPLKELQDYINNNVNVTLNGVPVMLRITEQGLFQYSTDGKVWRDTVDKNLEARLNEEILRATTKEGEIDTKVTTIEGNLSTVSSMLSQHKRDISNPHSVTKSQVGLGNVNNTSDLNKPISNAQATVNTTLTTRIADEEARAKGAENYISLSVSTEKNRAEGAERILSQSIREEETRAKAKELSIEINATSLENRLTDVSDNLSTFSDETRGELSTVKEDIKTQEEVNASQDRRLHLLEEAALGRLYSQDTITSYSNDVTIPSDALSLATLDMLGGMSRKGKNLLYSNYATRTLNGVTITNNNDGSYTLNGTSTVNGNLFNIGTIKLNSIQYTCLVVSSKEFSNDFYIDLTNLRNAGYSIKSGNSVTFTLNDTTSQYDFNFRVVMNLGQTFDNVIIKPMINEGSVLPYEPYTPNLIDGKVDDVVIYGKNLFNKEGEINSKRDGTIEQNINIKNVLNSDGDIVVNANGSATYGIGQVINLDIGTYTISFSIKSIGNGNGITFRCYDTNDYNTPLLNNSGLNVGKRSFSVNILKKGSYQFGWYVGGGTLPCGAIISDVLIEKGSTSTSYLPYREPIHKPIPSQVLSLPNYVIGVNNDVYNYLEFKDGKVLYHERVGSDVFDGSSDEIWTSTNKSEIASGGYFQCTFSKNAVGVTSPNIPPLLTNVFTTVANAYMYFKEYTASIGSTGERITIPYFNGINTTNALRTYLSTNPLVAYYELATEKDPIDVTDLFPFEYHKLNSIEANGHISFHYDNEYKVDIPNTISFLIKTLKEQQNG